MQQRWRRCTVSAIQSVALVGVYQCTTSPPNSGVHLELLHRVDVEPAAARFVRHSPLTPPPDRPVRAPAARASGRPRRARSCTSWAVRSIVRTPAAKPSRANTTRKIGRVPKAASSPKPIASPSTIPTTSSITMRQASEPWVNSPLVPARRARRDPPGRRRSGPRAASAARKRAPPPSAPTSPPAGRPRSGLDLGKRGKGMRPSGQAKAAHGPMSWIRISDGFSGAADTPRCPPDPQPNG